jgi:hypothetical protein
MIYGRYTTWPELIELTAPLWAIPATLFVAWLLQRCA